MNCSNCVRSIVICVLSFTGMRFGPSVALADEPARSSDAGDSVPSYRFLRAGMSEESARKRLELKCLGTKNQVTICDASPQGNEKRVRVWFYEARLVRLDVDFRDSWKQPVDEMMRPYVSAFGPPDKDESFPIPVGPMAGKTALIVVWNVEDYVLNLSAVKAGEGASKAEKISIMFVAGAPTSKIILNAAIAFEKAGFNLE